MKKTWKTCTRGHRFQKSSDCPVCPLCWSGYYRDRQKGDLPNELGAPAFRALVNAKITTLSKLSKYSEKEILDVHGMGPKSLPLLRAALKKKTLSFRKGTYIDGK